MANENKVKFPVWAIGIIISVLTIFGGGLVVWGQVRADVEALKGQYSEIKPMASQVGTLGNEVGNLSRRINEVRDEIKDIKQSQSETQRDIKTILLELKKP